MNNTEYTLIQQQRKPQAAAKCRSICSAIVMWLTLLLITFLAIPTFLLISVIGALWEFADITIRAIDS